MAAALVAVTVGGAASAGESFSDVAEGGVHRPAIEALDGLGVFESTECSPGRICPDDPIARWMVAVWLVRVLDGRASPAEAGGSSFAHVGEDEWWAPFAERLADLSVTAGCGAEPLRFCPDNPVTKGQMASFLVRALDLKPGPPAGFVDTGGSVHAGNINTLAAAGITAGCAVDPLRFCPSSPVTKGQMATFLARAQGLVALPVATRPETYRIGFVRQHPPVDRVFVMNANGTNPRQLLEEGHNWGGVWSPDGARIAFVGERFRETDPGNTTFDQEIFVMNPDGSGQYQLTDTDGYEHGPVWSPDASRIAFVNQTDLDPAPNVSRSDYQIFVANADGTDSRQLTERLGWNRDPVWSPDGSRIAFTRSNREINVPSIYVVNADGSDLESVAFGVFPAWSPDGPLIAYVDFGGEGPGARDRSDQARRHGPAAT